MSEMDNKLTRAYQAGRLAAEGIANGQQVDFPEYGRIYATRFAETLTMEFTRGIYDYRKEHGLLKPRKGG